MNAGETNNQIRPNASQQPSADLIATTDNKVQVFNNKKKLGVPNDLLKDIAKFKREIVAQRKSLKIEFLNPETRRNPKLDDDDDDDDDSGRAKHLLRVGVLALQDVIGDERSRRLEHVADLNRRLDGLRELNRAKTEQVADLERLLVDEDRVIESLRADVERVNVAYETRKMLFYGSYPPEEREESCPIRTGTLSGPASYRGSDEETRSPDGGRDVADHGYPMLRRAIESLRASNRKLTETVAALNDETERLRAQLSDAQAECMALDASKSGKKFEAVVLDDFCAVTEEITAQQLQNLEYGRIYEVDDKQMAEELNKVEQLRSKISRKQKKKSKLLKETISVRSQLEMYKSKYENLEKKKAILTDDLINGQSSACKLEDQFELQGFGQRAKHLKEMKILHNKLANKRDSLKLRLQRHQQVHVAKTPSRINKLYNP